MVCSASQSALSSGAQLLRSITDSRVNLAPWARSEPAHLFFIPIKVTTLAATLSHPCKRSIITGKYCSACEKKSYPPASNVKPDKKEKI